MGRALIILAQVGVGLLIDAAENSNGSFVFQLRPEMKGRWDFIDEPANDHFLDYMFGIGFQFAWGPARAPAPAPQASPPPPPPPAPKDSDGDGVLDDVDQCPGTPRGSAVDAVGCPRKGSVTLKGVNFEFNSSKLTAESRPILDDVAADLKQHPRLKVEMEGHTDSVGADAYNLKLSIHAGIITRKSRERASHQATRTKNQAGALNPTIYSQNARSYCADLAIP